jgi:uncharacterized Zn-binding protein involved in type VI secretion
MAGALRFGDNHVCPQGSPPHVGGPVGPVPLITTVLINDRFAAVVGDAVVCIGPPDQIMAGHSTVMIGGRPAASSTGRTQHGGNFVTCSLDVEIG